jgi:hypothetical protein
MAGWLSSARSAIFGTAGLLVVLGSTGAEARAQAFCAPYSPGCVLNAARPDLSACRVVARPAAKRTARNLFVPIQQRPFVAESRPVPSRYVSLLVLGVGY